MKASVILAHPNPRSFNHAIADCAEAQLVRSGHTVWRHDLQAEKFDPVAGPSELAKEAVLPSVIEKHCQELYPLIAAMGHEVFLATRRAYVINPQAEWQGVRLVHTYCPRSKSLEAIVHTFAAIFNRMPVRLATSIAMSTRFSGAMRPKKAR